MPDAQVFVATPKRLLEMLQNDRMTLEELRWFVIDEADMTLLRKAGPELSTHKSKKEIVTSEPIAEESEQLVKAALQFKGSPLC